MERIKPKDYLGLKRVMDVQVSNSHVAWVEKTPNPTDRGYKSCIKVLTRDTGSIRQFTGGAKQDIHPRFSPDGSKLAFISNRNCKNQIYVLSMNGGEGIKLTNTKNGVQNFEWAPDSKKIVFVALSSIEEEKESEPPRTPYDKERKKLAEKEEEEMEVDPRVITNITYRRMASYDRPEMYKHVFVIDLESKSTTRLAEGEFNYSLPQFISKDEFIVLSVRDKPWDQQMEASALKYSLDGTIAAEEITRFKSYYNGNPVGHQRGLVFIPCQGEGNYAGQNNKFGLLKDGNLEIINKDLDRSISQIRFLERDVLVSVETDGKADIRRYDVNSGKFTTLVDVPTSIVNFGATDTSELYFIGTDPKHVWAIYKWSSTDGLELIEDPNADAFADKLIVEPEEFWLTNPEGLKYQGWFFDAGMQNGKKPPLVLSIHGGPHVMWNNAGTMWHEWQSTLSAGYSVLAVNPIGSSGYGQDFAQKILPGKWGIEDSRDLLAAVDHFIDRVDPEKLYITGGSYAGFQTANVISRDHRFKAACAQRGVYDLVNFGLGTDIPLWWRDEMGGTPWDKLQELWNISPVGRAKHIETPLLILHAENDFRVQISQAEELFAALKLHGKDVVFVRYPRDGHELSRSGEPLHVVDRIERMLKWFEDHP